MASAVLSSMRGWGIVLGTLGAIGLAVACKPKTPPQPPPSSEDGVAGVDGPDTPSQSPAADDAADGADTATVPDGPTSQDPQCAAKGTPWDGSPQGCLYEHEGCCYPDPASVCAAARCDADTCQILESSPAQVRC